MSPAQAGMFLKMSFSLLICPSIGLFATALYDLLKGKMNVLLYPST